jgi:hypothetical protein
MKLTFGSNLNETAVRNAARPSFRTTANPPTSGEYSISTIYVLHSRSGTAANHKTIIIQYGRSTINAVRQ